MENTDQLTPLVDMVASTDNPSPLFQLGVPKGGHHVIWTTCRFIVQNPGCSMASLESHLNATYPHGSRIRFSWILDWFPTTVRGVFSEGTGTYMDLFVKLSKRSGSMARGIHILPSGSLVAQLPEPGKTFEKPKKMPSEWLMRNPEKGIMLVSRRKNPTVLRDEDGNYTKTGSYLTKDDVVLYHGILRQRMIGNERCMRLYGKPYLDATVLVLHHSGMICSVDASYVKPLKL